MGSIDILGSDPESKLRKIKEGAGLVGLIALSTIITPSVIALEYGKKSAGALKSAAGSLQDIIGQGLFALTGDSSISGVVPPTSISVAQTTPEFVSAVDAEDIRDYRGDDLAL